MISTLLKQKKSSVKTKVEGLNRLLILFGSFGTTPPWEGGGGGGGGGQPTFPGSDPFPAGDPGGGGPGGGCAGYGAYLAQGSTVSDEDITVITTNIDATHRTKLYTWLPFKGPLNIWRYESRDLTTQELIGGSWQFTGISHLSVTLAGTTTGFTLQYTDVLPPVLYYDYNSAYTDLKFRVRAVFYCGGNPFEFPFTPSPYGQSRKIFT